jgi:hypothetical protein
MLFSDNAVIAKAGIPLLYQGIAGQVPHDGSLSHSFP